MKSEEKGFATENNENGEVKGAQVNKVRTYLYASPSSPWGS